MDIDILIVAPNESKPLTPIIEEVYEQGIPVILVDRKTESELYTAFLGADNYEIGQTAAEYIINEFAGKGKVIEIQILMTISPAINRHRGFHETIAEYPDLEVVQELEIEGDLKELYEVFPSVLKKYPDAKIIYGHADILAETAYKIAENEGQAKEMFFVGIDGIPGTGRGIQAVEDGILDASMLYPTGGAEAIRLALSILNNLPYEKKNLLNTIVIDKENARILHNQMKKVNTLQEEIDAQQQKTFELANNFQKQQILIGILIIALFLIIILGSFLWRALWSKQRAYRKLEEKNKEVSLQKEELLAKQEELLEKQEEILQMNEKVRAATQAKVDFFTNISHEFKTPLTLILALTEDLVSNAARFGKEMKASILPVRKNAFRLLRLVNQLMDFRKVESEQMKIQASENDLVEFIQNIMISYYKIAKKRQIDFQLMSRYEQLQVWFDASMMDKVLFNMLSNAFKFTPDGGKIALSLSIDSFENEVKIKIEDNGMGMTKKEMQHVFEPFYQGKNQRKKGTGIGLSLSMALVQLHKGDIRLRSIKGKGSRFTIILPLGKKHFSKNQLVEQQQDYFAAPPAIAEGTTSLPKPIEKKNRGDNTEKVSILVIEDNEDLLHFLSIKLQNNYEVFTAIKAEKALELAYQHTPDLIICDILLGEQSGLNLTKTLKSDLRTSHIPIILLTALSNIEHQIKGTKAGADAYMIKPFNLQLLLEKIKNLLHNRQLLKEVYSNDLVELQPINHLSTLDQAFIKKFVRYVENNITRQDFQVTDLCEEMNISRSQLYRKVKALFGQSMSAYFQNIRLKKAEALLPNPKLSIADIAYQVGYTSPDYFAKVFKSKHNITPTQFRKKTLPTKK